MSKFPKEDEILLNSCMGKSEISSSSWEKACLRHPDGLKSFLTASFQGITPIISLSHHGQWKELNYFFELLKNDIRPHYLQGALTHTVDFCPLNSLKETIDVLKKNGASNLDLDSKDRVPLAALIERQIHFSQRSHYINQLFSPEALIVPDTQGITVWQKAIQFKMSDFVEKMSKYLTPEHLNGFDFQGWRACHWVASSGNKKILQILKNTGMENLPSKTGLLANDVAKNSGWETFNEDWDSKQSDKKKQIESNKPSINSHQMDLF